MNNKKRELSREQYLKLQMIFSGYLSSLNNNLESPAKSFF